MRGYRLSRRAEQRLERILGWTLDHFGRSQAQRYKSRLISRLEAFAAGKPPHGRSCSVLSAGLRETGDLAYYLEGRHYIIFRDADEALFVVDFVHGSRDLEAIVRDLSRSLGPEGGS